MPDSRRAFGAAGELGGKSFDPSKQLSHKKEIVAQAMLHRELKAEDVMEVLDCSRRGI